MEKLYLFNVYTFCKSLCIINVGSPYGLHGDPIYIWYLYDQMWLVGLSFIVTLKCGVRDDFHAHTATIIEICHITVQRSFFFGPCEDAHLGTPSWHGCLTLPLHQCGGYIVTLKKITESVLSLLDPHRPTGWVNLVRPTWASQDVNVGHSWLVLKVFDSSGRVNNDPH